MTIAEMIIDKAKSIGLSHYFGLPGSGALMDIMEAGRKAGVEFVSVAHESSAAIAAAYYGHMRGAAGLAMAIKGPGAANLVGGAATVFFERMPAVCLCDSVIVEKPMAQICDHRELFQAVTKAYMRLSKSGASEDVTRAFSLAADGHPGPVMVDLPADIAAETCSASSGGPSGNSGPGIVSPSQEQPAAEALAAAGRFLDSLSRPVIIAGADVYRDGALAELKRLAESLKAAVLVTFDARGVMPEDDPRFAGVYTGLPSPNILGNRVLSEADGVLLIGVDSIMTETLWKKNLPACELVSHSDYGTLTDQPKVRVDGNLKATIDGLPAMENKEGYLPARIGDLRQEAGLRFVRPPAARLAVQDIIETTRGMLPKDGVLFSETGIFVLMLEQLWPVYAPNTFFGTTAGRTMGLMIPAILGAKLAQPEMSMVGLGANGSSLMRLGELEVFSRTGISVPLIVVNDGCLGTIKSRQKSKNLEPYSLNLHPVDFAGAARSFGLNGVIAQTPEEFRAELARAFEAERTTVIDARVDAQAYQDSFGPTIGDL